MQKIFAVVLISLVVLPPQAFAQGDDGWHRLQTVARGDGVRLRLKSGAEVEGILASLDNESVVLDKTQLRRGTFHSTTGGQLGGTITFLRGDVAGVIGPKAGKGMSAGRKLLLAGLAAGFVFLLSPAGQCITSSTGC